MATTDTRTSRVTPKDPDNGADRGVNFKDLLPDNVTLASAAIVACTPSGLVSAELPVAAVVTGTRAAYRFTGGTAGVDYSVTFRGTYSDGQTKDVTIILPVRGA
jgi:hypothetical protein